MSRRDSVLVNRSLYQIGILTVVASIIWVGVGIYTAMVNPLAVEVDKNMLLPLPATLDTSVIESLTQRLKVESSIELLSNSSNLATGSGETNDTIVVDQQDEPTN